MSDAHNDDGPGEWFREWVHRHPTRRCELVFPKGAGVPFLRAVDPTSGQSWEASDVTGIATAMGYEPGLEAPRCPRCGSRISEVLQRWQDGRTVERVCSACHHAFKTEGLFATSAPPSITAGRPLPTTSGFPMLGPNPVAFPAPSSTDLRVPAGSTAELGTGRAPDLSRELVPGHDTEGPSGELELGPTFHDPSRR